MPHKERIIPLLAAVDATADKIGAVNTVVRKKDGWTGYNFARFSAQKET